MGEVIACGPDGTCASPTTPGKVDTPISYRHQPTLAICPGDGSGTGLCAVEPDRPMDRKEAEEAESCADCVALPAQLRQDTQEETEPEATACGRDGTTCMRPTSSH